jgi:PKD repeat protein
MTQANSYASSSTGPTVIRLPVFAMAIVMASSLVAQVQAQSTQTLPAGYANTEGNSNNGYPWGTTDVRVQFCYDTRHFSSTSPILIRRMRFRADGSTIKKWAGGKFKDVAISMSTSVFDHLSLSTVFATNHGADKTVVYQGDVAVAAQTSGGSVPQSSWYIDIRFQQDFVYDPSAGDLLVDLQIASLIGESFRSDAVSAAQSGCSRVYNASSHLATTGNFARNEALICEIDSVAASGLHANFRATPMLGNSPLQVQFTDTSHCTDTGGITSWAWDFDGDQVIDSTLQNPMHVFQASGFEKPFDVSLTVTDASHPVSTELKRSFVVLNPYPAATATQFGLGSTIPLVPGPMQLPQQARVSISPSKTYGYFFQAPAAMTLTGFEAPNTYNRPEQSIWAFVFPAKPKGSDYITASETRFFGRGPANTVLTPSSPIAIPKDSWVGILGATHSSTSTSMDNSLSELATSHSTTLLGLPVTLSYASHPASLVNANGTGLVSTGTGEIGLVQLHVQGNPLLGHLKTSGIPSFGSTPKLELDPGFGAVDAGLVLMTLQPLPSGAPTPYGKLLVLPPFLMTFVVPGGTGQIPLPIPVQKSLAGGHIYFQSVYFDLQNNIFGTSNGVDWMLGL